MAQYQVRQNIADKAIIRTTAPADVAAPAHQVDRTFELPRGLYIATVSCYLGFLAIMATGFSSPGLIVPMGIFVIFIVPGFGVPAIWTKLTPENASTAKSWGELRSSGIATLTGRLSRSEASIQMLILPVLIVMWGLAVVTIAALV